MGGGGKGVLETKGSLPDSPAVLEAWSAQKRYDGDPRRMVVNKHGLVVGPSYARPHESLGRFGVVEQMGTRPMSPDTHQLRQPQLPNGP